MEYICYIIGIPFMKPNTSECPSKHFIIWFSSFTFPFPQKTNCSFTWSVFIKTFLPQTACLSG